MYIKDRGQKKSAMVYQNMFQALQVADRGNTRSSCELQLQLASSWRLELEKKQMMQSHTISNLPTIFSWCRASHNSVEVGEKKLLVLFWVSDVIVLVDPWTSSLEVHMKKD
jgi:hypothetical protein